MSNNIHNPLVYIVSSPYSSEKSKDDSFDLDINELVNNVIDKKKVAPDCETDKENSVANSFVGGVRWSKDHPLDDSKTFKSKFNNLKKEGKKCKKQKQKLESLKRQKEKEPMFSPDVFLSTSPEELVSLILSNFTHFFNK
jgi:hypothetical protein